jgi:predicted NUDIX family NTP pyrophosphohydrolase
MNKLSAGILVYRKNKDEVEVLLAHLGGPFWAKKDDGAWSIFKGEYEGDEKAFDAAKREFKEETSHDPPEGEYIELGEISRKDGKIITAWAVEADFDEDTIVSNLFEMQWPPRSGKLQEFPENDRAAWFTLSDAFPKMHSGQLIFIERLVEKLGLSKIEAKKPNQQQLL